MSSLTLESLNDTLTNINSTLFGLDADGAPNLAGLVGNLGQYEGTADINAGFTLISGYLVFFMQAGFAMLCAGAVRAKNAKNIILLNLLDACMGSIAWYLTGWAFAFGDPASTDEDGNTFDADGNQIGTLSITQAFIGNRFFVMNNFPRASYVSWFFQFTFAATGATIVSGAVAERCKFQAYLLYELMIVMFVYPVFAHWVWSPYGWMSALRTTATSQKQGYTLWCGSGVYDFAGDGPVHMVGGFASLAGAKVLGPRIGRFDSQGNPVDMPGHNAALNLLGVFMLWFGWYGFNPGSTNAIMNGVSQLASAIAINTTIAAATGCLSTLFIAMIHQYFSLGVVVWDLLIAGNGALAGLVAITGPCAYVNTWSAVIIGIIGGGVYYMVSKINLYWLKVDDPLDAIAVHAGCGAWGMIGCAAFAAQNLVDGYYGDSPYLNEDGTPDQRAIGFIMGGDGSLLAAHTTYIIMCAAWVLSIMFPFFYILKKVGLFRVSPEVEAQGLDVSHHGGSAYPHDKSGKGADAGMAMLSSDMIDRKIEEALAKFKKEQSVADVV
jgi:Amt family ammonium transporter